MYPDAANDLCIDIVRCNRLGQEVINALIKNRCISIGTSKEPFSIRWFIYPDKTSTREQLVWDGDSSRLIHSYYDTDGTHLYTEE